MIRMKNGFFGLLVLATISTAFASEDSRVDGDGQKYFLCSIECGSPAGAISQGELCVQADTAGEAAETYYDYLKQHKPPFECGLIGKGCEISSAENCGRPIN